MTYDAMLPTLLSTKEPENGSPWELPFKFVSGYGLTTKEIGVVLSIHRVYSVVATIFIFPVVVRRLGALGLFRTITLSYPLLYIVTPYMILLPESVRMVGVYVLVVWKCTCATLAYPSNAILLTNSATVQAILDSASRSTSQSALQSALQSVLDRGNPQFIPKETIQRILESHPVPPPAELTPEPTLDTRPIWPGRIELIYKQYIVEKEAWLTTYPTVRPSNYREKRGLESYSPRWCKEQSRYLPDHRIDLETETIVEGRPLDY
jgi:hypothetical protein